MFNIVIKIFGSVCILVGLLHICLGLNADNLLGAGLSVETIANPSLDSQNRFYGATFMLFGVVAWISSTNLKQTKLLFRTIMVVFFIGGIARIISLSIYGAPSNLIQILTAIELILPPLLLLWHQKLLSE